MNLTLGEKLFVFGFLCATMILIISAQHGMEVLASDLETLLDRSMNP